MSSSPPPKPTLATSESDTALSIAETIHAPSQAKDAPNDNPMSASGLGFSRGDSLDHFIVIDLLGQGGMGAVVAAYDPDLDRKVALKVLRPDAWDESSLREGQQRLLREAQAMAKLSHPNVVTVHEVGTVGNRVFLAMEYIEGRTLRAWLAESPRTWREVVDVFVQAGQGLSAAHKAGCVHRDFKPDNVLLGNDGRVCVMDFGLASTGLRTEEGPQLEIEVPDDSPQVSLRSSLGSQPLTRTGAVFGTPAYMAPEQYKDARVGAAADQFSFCVALYEALFGQPPFPGDNLLELHASVSLGRLRPPPAGHSVPLWVQEIVLRGLRTDPSERFPTMDALLQVLSVDPTAARSRRRRLFGVVSAMVLLLGLAAFGFTRGLRPRACPEARAELVGVWDDAAAERVRKSFLSTGRPFAADTFAQVRNLLDTYAGTWTATRANACEATYTRRQQSERVFDLQLRCLQRRRAELQALSSLLASKADTELLDRAVPVAAGLTPVASCTDTEALESAVPLPEDPTSRAKVDALREQLVEANTLFVAGKYREGLAQARTLAEAVRTVGYGPLYAEALHLLGQLQSAAGDPTAAQNTLEQAVSEAAASKHDAELARLWIDLIDVLGDRLRQPERALALRRVADAAITRAGNDPLLRARLLFVVGNVLFLEGKCVEARNDLERSLSLREAARGSEDSSVASTLNSLGVVAGCQGKLEEASRFHQRALAIRQKILGADHPNVTASWLNLGVVFAQQGKYAEALAHYQRALAISEKRLGPEHPTVASVLDNSGFALARLGRFNEALSHHERALAIREKTLKADHPSLGESLVGKGSCLVDLGRAAEAVAPLERSLTLFQTGKAAPVETAAAQFALARARWETNRDRARALSLAKTAQAAFAAAGEGATRDRLEVEQWLSKRAATP